VFNFVKIHLLLDIHEKSVSVRKHDQIRSEIDWYFCVEPLELSLT